MKQVKWTELVGLKERVVKDCVGWARVCLGDSKRLHDYEAGVNEGWNKAISVLKLHGHIKVDYK